MDKQPAPAALSAPDSVSSYISVCRPIPVSPLIIFCDMSDNVRRFQGTNGEFFWVTPNQPACSECQRFDLPCVARVGSGGSSCYQCAQRRHACPLARQKKCPRSLRGSGFADDLSSEHHGPTGPRSASDSSRHLRTPTPYATSSLRSRSSPTTPPSLARTALQNSRSRGNSSSSSAAPRRASSGSPSPSRQQVLNIQGLSLSPSAPIPSAPVLLDLTAPGPARAVSITDSLSVFSRSPSPARRSRASSSESSLSVQSRTPSLPDQEGLPSPREMRMRRLARMSRLRESTVFEEATNGEITGSCSEFPPGPSNPFDQRF